MSLNRRRFMQTSLAAGAALTLPLGRPSKVRGANDAIRAGFVGLRGRGASSIRWFRGISGVQIAAVCDCDSNILQREVERCEEAGDNVTGYVDVRQMLDNKDIDVVVLSMPVHWHSLAGIWACQAGKDVYVEKPVSHNVWEGRQLVAAARRHNRIVQGGTQQRSDPALAQVRKFLLEDKELGEVKWVRSNRYGVRGSIGKVTQPTPVPEHIDYNLWAGPAPATPVMRRSFHYDWHWQWPYGAGEMGNWGVHILDDVRYLLDMPLMPKRCLAGGGRFWDDDGDTPNVHFVYYDTGVVPVYFDLSNMNATPDQRGARNYRGIRDGSVIQCEGGYYAGGRGGGWAYDNDGERIRQFRGDSGGGHARNFINAVRTRNREDLNAEVEQTHGTSAWCHLGNVSYRLGQQYRKEQALEMVRSTGIWEEMLEGVHEHLMAHNVKAEDVKLGAMLELDQRNETLTGRTATPQARALLRREYRRPFVVPSLV